MQTTRQGRRLKAAPSLPMWPVLEQEFRNFKATISQAGRDSYGAGDDWRVGNHDDLVLASSLAVWFGEYRPHRGSQTLASSYLDAADDGAPDGAEDRYSIADRPIQ